MAVRLQMKLGVVAETDRLPDSPDTLVVVEPNVGSVARSKGLLYLLVTSRISSRHALEATRLAAETIRNEYYYDESAGIRVCIQKAVGTANKRLAHQADRLGLKSTDENGPIGVALAVVRGNEMYVATVGPAEAYLIRQARLSTLPDPHRERGLPSGDLEPDVWRGEVSVGDSLVLISPNVMAKLGADELKDAMLTLHPQSAMEHLHHRFVADGGAGSDGAIAFEAAEVSATARGRAPVPVKPPEPLAGAPDRSPIPLADNVAAAGTAVTAAAGSAKVAAGGFMGRIVRGFQDLLPRRKPAYRRVTPLASRRETQRRAALALLALVVVVGGLGLAVYAFGGARASRRPSARSTPARRRSTPPRRTSPRSRAPASTSSSTTRRRPRSSSPTPTSSCRPLARRRSARPSIAPLQQQAMDGLDRLYGVVPVASSTLFTFNPAEGADPIDLRALVKGPDGAPYVIDASTKTVYRIDLKSKKATVVARAGQKAGGTTVATPRFLAVGGPDLLVLDSKNVLWRWRPSNSSGKGTLTKVKVNGSASWGDDVIRHRDVSQGSRPAASTTCTSIDPSEQQIRAYSPAFDGSGFPQASSGWLATARPVDGMSSLYIDGDLFATEDGKLERFTSGKNDGWSPDKPGRRAPAPRHQVHDRVRRHGPPDRGRLRLRRPELAHRRHRQGERRLQGPVPARRRPAGLGGHARHGHHVRDRPDARQPDLDLEGRRPPGDAGGRRCGHGQPVPVRVGAGVRHPETEADQDAETDEEAVVRGSDDPAARRQSDPPRARRHDRHPHRLLRGLGLGARPAGERRRDGAERLHRRSGGSSRASSRRRGAPVGSSRSRR